MSEQSTDAPVTGADAGESVLLDGVSERLDSIKLLRADTDEERARVLEQFGAWGPTDRDILQEQAQRPPLWRPDRFDEAHRVFMRGLEVLDRNGARAPRVPDRIGPLEPVAAWVTQLIVRWIVRSHQNRLMEKVHRLYEYREANAVWGSREHHSLRRARLHLDRVTQTKPKALGLPSFLVGGAFISGAASGLGGLIQAALGSPLLVALLVAVALLLLLGAGWAVLYGAGTARRRIRLATDEPIRALYETIGSCGDPPKDQAFQLALMAIAIFALAAIVVPAGLGLLVSLG